MLAPTYRHATRVVCGGLSRTGRVDSCNRPTAGLGGADVLAFEVLQLPPLRSWEIKGRVVSRAGNVSLWFTVICVNELAIVHREPDELENVMKINEEPRITRHVHSVGAKGAQQLRARRGLKLSRLGETLERIPHRRSLSFRANVSVLGAVAGRLRNPAHGRLNGPRRTNSTPFRP